MFFNQYVEDDCKKILNSISLTKFKNKNILILGSNGFLASYIASVLYLSNKHKNNNCKITCVSLNKPRGILKDILKKKKTFLNFVRLDLANLKDLKQFLKKKKYDYIFHAATYGQPEKWGQNLLSSTILLNTSVLEELIIYSLRINSKIMYFSSADVYDLKKKNKSLIKENFILGLPNNSHRKIYASSKIMGENICEIYKKKFNAKLYIVRPAHTFGPGQSIQDRRVISQMIKRCLIEKKVYIFGNGKSVKTWGYISEITQMFLNIMQYGKSMTYNTSGSNFLSIENVGQFIAKHEKIKFFKKKLDESVFVSKDYEIIKISSQKYRKEFRKRHSSIDFKEGIHNFIEWNKVILNENK